MRDRRKNDFRKLDTLEPSYFKFEFEYIKKKTNVAIKTTKDKDQKK
jgi:hypothetical protein